MFTALPQLVTLRKQHLVTALIITHVVSLAKEYSLRPGRVDQQSTWMCSRKPSKCSQKCGCWFYNCARAALPPSNCDIICQSRDFAEIRFHQNLILGDPI
jgi:hypothetical protein